MRVFLILSGALLGLVFALQAGAWLAGVAAGAFIGYAVAEFLAGRSRIERLENEVAELRRRAAARDADATASADAAATPTPPAAPSASTRPTRPVPTLSPAEGAASSVGNTSSGYSVPRPEEFVRVPPVTWPPNPREPQDPPLIRAIRDYLTGGNTLARVGVIILFIGVAFLVRYVAEHTYLPIELRLSGVAAVGVVLLGLGWRLRAKRPAYALALQGGAIGILYLTVFAALRLFHVMPPGAAFAVLVLLAALCAALAVLQDSMAFALLAIGCGFLAPVLASSGQGNHVVLFSYYAVLNLGVFSIAWFKAWRPLNVVGFLFTFVIGTAWGVLRYRPELFASTEPFLIGFFLLYVAIAVLFSLRQQPVLKGYVDGTIVFGTPVVAFSLQSAMAHHWHFALAYSALAVSAMYLVLAWLLFRGRRETQRLLVEAFLALGIAFLTLAVPLALDGRWSAATWALEGAALVWVGCRQGRRLPRASGALLQIASGLIFLIDVQAPYSAVPVLNSACLGGVMIAVASVFACRELIKARETLAYHEGPVATILFFWGLLWWLIAGLNEIGRHIDDEYALAGAHDAAGDVRLRRDHVDAGFASVRRWRLRRVASRIRRLLLLVSPRGEPRRRWLLARSAHRICAPVGRRRVVGVCVAGRCRSAGARLLPSNRLGAHRSGRALGAPEAERALRMAFRPASGDVRRDRWQCARHLSRAVECGHELHTGR